MLSMSNLSLLWYVFQRYKKKSVILSLDWHKLKKSRHFEGFELVVVPFKDETFFEDLMPFQLKEKFNPLASLTIMSLQLSFNLQSSSLFCKVYYNVTYYYYYVPYNYFNRIDAIKKNMNDFVKKKLQFIAII